MVFLVYALMHIGAWVCTLIAAIYFNDPAIIWIAVIASIVLPTPKVHTITKEKENNKDDYC